MGLGNEILEMAELFKVNDKVKVLPNKGYGIITRVSNSGFIFLDNKNYRPYLPTQLQKVSKIPRSKKLRKQHSACYRFWFERPHPLADEDTPQDFFIGMIFAFAIMMVFLLMIVGSILMFR